MEMIIYASSEPNPHNRIKELCYTILELKYQQT